MKKPYIPKRGDVVWVNLPKTTGHIQSGRRPALVLSPEVHNLKTKTAVICPMTLKPKGYHFEVLFPMNNFSRAILVDQIRTIDLGGRGVDFVTMVSRAVLDDVQAKLSVLVL